MTKYVLHVESRPASEEAVDAFNRWYDEVHLPEMVALDGFASAVRYAPREPGGPYIAHYEIEGDPQQAVKNVTAAAADGRLRMSDVISMEPAPRMQILKLTTEYPTHPWPRDTSSSTANLSAPTPRLPRTTRPPAIYSATPPRPPRSRRGRPSPPPAAPSTPPAGPPTRSCAAAVWTSCTARSSNTARSCGS